MTLGHFPHGAIDGPAAVVDIEGCDTIVKLFARRCAALGERTAHREKHLGIWMSYSWRDFYANAELIGLGLLSLGVERGDVVAILSDDNKEWLYADFGAQAIGAIVTGVYPTDPPERLLHQLVDSQARVLFVGNDEQLDKFLAIRQQLPRPVTVVVFDDEGLHDFRDERILMLDQLYLAGRRFGDRARFAAEISRSAPEDLAILVYTSGTTGAPRGAMISHANFMASIAAATICLPSAAEDEQVCFLPLCHILERLISAYLPVATMARLNFAESPDTVFDCLREVSPHSFVAVPRVWEKLHAEVMLRLEQATPLQRRVFARALAAGHAHAAFEAAGRTSPAWIRWRHRFWDRLVLANVRRMLGLDRLRRAGTGAAPISPDLLLWFRALGVPLFEGYGMTETTGLIAVNGAGRDRIGSVGRVIPGGEIRIGADDEVQYRRGNVFRGYWRDEAASAACFTVDGWLRTGDTGWIDQDGYLHLSGRLKDLIITSGGKNIAPAEIESRLKFSPYIADAVVIGDGRNYLTALIMIDRDNVEKYAQDHRIPFGDFRSLCHAAEIRDLIAGVVEETNRHLAHVEQIKDFRLIDRLLAAEDEELTPTMKLKRRLVEQKYGALIEQMYRGTDGSTG